MYNLCISVNLLFVLFDLEVKNLDYMVMFRINSDCKIYLRIVSLIRKIISLCVRASTCILDSITAEKHFSFPVFFQSCFITVVCCYFSTKADWWRYLQVSEGKIEGIYVLSLSWIMKRLCRNLL